MVKSRDAGIARREESVENILPILQICEMDEEVCRCAQEYVSAQHLPISKSVCRRTGIWPNPARKKAIDVLKTTFDKCVSRKTTSVLDDVLFHHTGHECTDATRTITQMARLPRVVQIDSITLCVAR